MGKVRGHGSQTSVDDNSLPNNRARRNSRALVITDIELKVMAGGEPISSQVTKVITATSTTAGTNQAATTSTRC